MDADSPSMNDTAYEDVLLGMSYDGCVCLVCLCVCVCAGGGAGIGGWGVFNNGINNLHDL